MLAHRQAQRVQIQALVPPCHGVASSYSRQPQRRHPRLRTLVLVQYRRRRRCNMVRARVQASRSCLARISTNRGRDMAHMGRVGRRCIPLSNISVPRTRTSPSSIRPLRRRHLIILVINDSHLCTLNLPSHRHRISTAPTMTRLSSSHIRIPLFRRNQRLSEQELIPMRVVRRLAHPSCTRCHSIHRMRRCASLRLLPSRIRLNSISSFRDRGSSNSSRS